MSREYACLGQASAEGDLIRIVPVAFEHIENIRIWRNSQIRYLRQSRPIAPLEQIEYFEREVWSQLETDTPKRILWSILQKKRLVGYGGLVHLDWINLRAEVSFLLDPQIEAQTNLRAQIFCDFLTLVKRAAFDVLRLNKLTAETFSFRSAAIEALEMSGFSQEGILRGQWYIDGGYCDSRLHGLLSSDQAEFLKPRHNHEV